MSDDTDTTRLLMKVSEDARPLPKFSRNKDGFSRTDVVQAFQRAFDMIGGVERLTLWANDHETEFYRLYSKLLPATTVVLGNVGITEIVHRLAPTALDQHSPSPQPIQDVAFKEVIDAD